MKVLLRFSDLLPVLCTEPSLKPPPKKKCGCLGQVIAEQAPTISNLYFGQKDICCSIDVGCLMEVATGAACTVFVV